MPIFAVTMLFKLDIILPLLESQANLAFIHDLPNQLILLIAIYLLAES